MATINVSLLEVAYILPGSILACYTWTLYCHAYCCVAISWRLYCHAHYFVGIIFLPHCLFSAIVYIAMPNYYDDSPYCNALFGSFKQ
jgi:hypothetical protein